MTYKFTNSCNKAIEIASDIAMELGHSYIGTEHLLYGLVKEGNGVASKVLQNQDITDEDIVVITCDHATPCELKIHSTDKVPVLIAGNQCIKDGSLKFDEANAERGKLPIQKAIDIFPYIIKKLHKEN